MTTEWLSLSVAVLALIVAAWSATTARRTASYVRLRDEPRLEFAASLTTSGEARLLHVSVTNSGFRPLEVTTGGFKYAGGAFMSGREGVVTSMLTDGESLAMSIGVRGDERPEFVWVTDAAGRHHQAAIADVLSPLNPGPLTPVASGLFMGEEPTRRTKRR